MMKRFAVLTVATVLASGAVGTLQASTAERNAAGPVTVTIDYKGSGTIDNTHRVWVWLFDTPEIGPGSMPIAEVSVVKNGEAAKFDVAGDRVWIAVAYDEKGVMSGNSPPAPGSPIAIYSSATGAPEGVTPGPKGVVKLTFDDSQRMP